MFVCVCVCVGVCVRAPQDWMVFECASMSLVPSTIVNRIIASSMSFDIRKSAHEIMLISLRPGPFPKGYYDCCESSWDWSQVAGACQSPASVEQRRQEFYQRQVCGSMALEQVMG